MKNITKSLIIGGLASILAGCATLKESQNKDDVRNLTKICQNQVDYRKIYFRDNFRYQIKCEEHSGIQVVDLESMKITRINYPKPKKLTDKEIAPYVTGKNVVLFGESHEPGVDHDSKKFISYLPQLHENGFTHIGLEIDYRWQSFVDAYQSSPSEENKQNLLRELPYVDNVKEEFVDIIENATKKALRVICLDNRNPESKVERDDNMKESILEVIANGGKIAGFLGANHIRWSKDTIIGATPYNTKEGGDESSNPVMSMDIITPVGRLLIDALGKDQIGLIDLTSCSDDYIYACVEN